MQILAYLVYAAGSRGRRGAAGVSTGLVRPLGPRSA